MQISKKTMLFSVYYKDLTYIKWGKENNKVYNSIYRPE